MKNSSSQKSHYGGNNTNISQTIEDFISKSLLNVNVDKIQIKHNISEVDRSIKKPQSYKNNLKKMLYNIRKKSIKQRISNIIKKKPTSPSNTFESSSSDSSELSSEYQYPDRDIPNTKEFIIESKSSDENPSSDSSTSSGSLSKYL